jgi:3-oxoacyl-[acyl-carrier protein] reductase
MSDASPGGPVGPTPTFGGLPSLGDRDLDGRVALVTGGGSGIGRAAAHLLASAGAHVWVLDLSGERASDVASAISSSSGGAGASSAALDVRDPGAVAALVTSVMATGGRIDVLANVAGVMQYGPVADLTDDDLEAVLATNLKGPFHMARAVLPHMVAAGSGSIVSVASAAVHVAAPGLFAYSASKAGLVQLTRILAVEGGPHGVRANAVAPGWIPTGMTGRHFVRPDGTVDDEAFERVSAPMAAGSPLGRVGDAGDIAHAIAFLASDAAGFVTGHVLSVDGGVTLS